MLGCSNIKSIGLHTMEIMELIQLGKIEKVSVSLQCKYTSLNLRWFRSKHTNNIESRVKKVQKYNDVYIEPDGIIAINFKLGETDSIEYYRVLGIFIKYYNKWFININSAKILWNKDSKKYKFLARLKKRIMQSLKKFSSIKTGTRVQNMCFISSIFLKL